MLLTTHNSFLTAGLDLKFKSVRVSATPPVPRLYSLIKFVLAAGTEFHSKFNHPENIEYNLHNRPLNHTDRFYQTKMHRGSSELNCTDRRLDLLKDHHFYHLESSLVDDSFTFSVF